MKSKKAQIEIILLVILILFLVSTTIFSFITNSSKIETTISNSNLVRNIYSKENSIEFYIVQEGKHAIVKTYDFFVRNNKFADSNTKEFAELSQNLRDDFILEFRENFRQSFQDYSGEDIKNLKDLVLQGNFNVDFEENIILKIDNLEEKDFSKRMNIGFFPKFNLEFDFSDMGLHSFDEVYEVKEKCKNSIESECYNDLFNFNVEIEEKESGNLVKFESKKEFLIGDEIRKIDFDFIPR
ncbi:MAG: hypothetical protein P8X70_00955 [Nanoarchaeota archaeon]